MKSFPLSLFQGHPIIVDKENIILIDTGNPSTIHVSDSIDFCSERFGCTTNYMGLTVQQISEMLGTKITTLLGADILSNFKICLDYSNEVVEFHKEAIRMEGVEKGISKFMGIPIIDLNIGDQNLKFFLDTGAKLSYLPGHITGHYASIGTAEDFYPGVGNFETPCYEIPTICGDHHFPVKYGNLPSLLQMSLMLGGTDGIIGFDFFNHFRVALDLENNRLEYVR